MKLQRIFRADKLNNLICERFKRDGDTIRKIATPSFYGKLPYIAFPGDSLTRTSSDAERDTVKFFFEVEQKPSVLLTQMFPKGRMVDDSHIEVDKPLLLENKGGEYISTNLNIEALEIVNIDLLTSKPLTIKNVTKNIQKDKYTFETTEYSNFFSSVFEGYDENKSLKENYNAGCFDDKFKVETNIFNIGYESSLDVPRHWEDGASSVYYSKYCTLTPENKIFKFYVEFKIIQDHIDFNWLRLYKTERFTLPKVPTFSKIIY